MNWEIRYLKEADRDYGKLSHTQQSAVTKAIDKVSRNPLPMAEGGYGKPLGHQDGIDLTGLLKIKLRGEGLRVVYKLIRTETTMLVLVIQIREDKEVYKTAFARRKKYRI